MAFDQKITDRYKAVGFYKHIEWNRTKGILIKIYNPSRIDGKVVTTFEKGVHDIDYDQKFDEYRQIFLSRREAVGFMLNLGMQTLEIARTFQLVDGGNLVSVKR